MSPYATFHHNINKTFLMNFHSGLLNKLIHIYKLMIETPHTWSNMSNVRTNVLCLAVYGGMILFFLNMKRQRVSKMCSVYIFQIRVCPLCVRDGLNRRKLYSGVGSGGCANCRRHYPRDLEIAKLDSEGFIGALHFCSGTALCWIQDGCIRPEEIPLQ